MILNLHNDLEQYMKCLKEKYFIKVKNGYNKNKVNTLRAAGYSDDDIFMAEMLGVYKGVLETDWLK